jgi:tetratricopeptide (TPR) repeat protein
MKYKPQLTGQPAFDVPTLQDDMGQLQILSRLIGDRHDAAELQDLAKIARLDDQELPLACDQFERGESSNDPNPPCRRRMMHAATHAVRGRHDLAYEYDLDAWYWAEKNPLGMESVEKVKQLKAVCASNLSDDLRHLQRYDEAVQWGRTACDLWSANPVNFLVLGMALYYAGKHDLANRIFGQVREIAAAQEKRNKLEFCLTYERELRDLDSLPAVRLLLQEYQESRRAG